MISPMGIALRLARLVRLLRGKGDPLPLRVFEGDLAGIGPNEGCQRTGAFVLGTCNDNHSH